jgi:hypothetical protein
MHPPYKNHNTYHHQETQFTFPIKYINNAARNPLHHQNQCSPTAPLKNNHQTHPSNTLTCKQTNNTQTLKETQDIKLLTYTLLDDE